MKQLNKYFVFSDVHGEYDALMKSLEQAGYNPNNKTHKLVSLGDNFDRGLKSKQIFRFLYDNKAICIKGNHDAMFQEYLEKGMDGEFVLFNILHNGLGETISSFSGLLDRDFNPQILQNAKNNIDARVLKWIQSMPLYFETDTFIFSHAGIDPDLPNWRATEESHLLWDIENSYRPCKYTDGKIVVIGHHHATRVRRQAEEHGCLSTPLQNVSYRNYSPEDDYGNRSMRKFHVYGNEDENAPVVIDNKIAIDGCTNLTHKVNVVVIEDYEKDTGEGTTVTNSPDHTPDTSIRATREAVSRDLNDGLYTTFEYVNNWGEANYVTYATTTNRR